MSEDRRGSGSGSGGVVPAAGQPERQRQRAYERGRRARCMKDAGRLWMQPHYPVEDFDLAHAWLEGWEDMGDEAELARVGQRPSSDD